MMQHYKFLTLLAWVRANSFSIVKHALLGSGIMRHTQLGIILQGCEASITVMRCTILVKQNPFKIKSAVKNNAQPSSFLLGFGQFIKIAKKPILLTLSPQTIFTSRGN
jgi:hypothetical protein